ncbi:MAG: YbaY family lipoprotein [Beijerinckiaceae bacterium]
MRLFRATFVTAFLATGFVGVAEAAPRKLAGTLAYRERIALPPDARAEVTLVDVARADAAATIVGQTTVSPAGQVPIRWEMTFDDNALQPRGRYALQARILSGERLLFVTTQSNPVFGGGKDKTDLMLQSTRAPDRPAPAPDPAQKWQGRWLAENIGGGGVLDRVQSYIEIGPDGSVAGSGGCNRIFGKARIDRAEMSFGAMGSTQMACPLAVMDQERKFLDALMAARAWRADEQRRKLLLLDADGKTLLVLSRM